MPNSIGTAYINIQPSADGISGSIQDVIGPEASSAGDLAGENITSSLSSKLQSWGKDMAKTGAMMTALSVPLLAGINSTMDAYTEQLMAETKLTEIYKSRMGATEDAANSTMKLAAALQKEGVVGDEVTIAGAQQLATFAKYPDTVDTLLPALDNLLVQQNGLSATTQDAVGLANLFGKAMMGQTGALRRVGISFDESQEAVLKYGTESEKAAMLLEVVNQNVGDMNAAMAETDVGKIQQFRNAMGDLKEQVGGALAPVLKDLANWFMDKIVPKLEAFVAFMQAHPIIAKIIIGLTGILAIGGPLLIMLGGIVASVGALIPVAGAITAPMLGVAAAIAEVIAVGVLVIKNWDTIKAKAAEIWGKIKNTAASIWGGITGVISGAVNRIKAIIGGIGTVLASVRAAFNRIKEAITKPITAAKEAVQKAIDKIKSIFPLKLGKIFSGIKLPHFKISGGKIPWGIGGKGEKPTVGIDWYAQGGIMTKPVLFGGGEAGDEAIVPLDPFWRKLDRMTGASGNTVNVTVNVTGAENPEDFAIRLANRLKMEMRTV